MHFTLKRSLHPDLMKNIIRILQLWREINTEIPLHMLGDPPYGTSVWTGGSVNRRWRSCVTDENCFISLRIYKQ